MAKRSLLSLMIVLGLGLGLAGPQAGAAKPKKKKFGSQITITYAAVDEAFTGEVSSKVSRCVRGRDVTLFETFEGQMPMAVGTDRVGADGRYEIRRTFSLGASYYAKVDRKASPRTVCLGARTDDVG